MTTLVLLRDDSNVTDDCILTLFLVTVSGEGVLALHF